MSEKIFIARQDTLEEVKTAAADNGGKLAQVLACLGTGETGENALSGAIIPAQLLNDYKLYGVDSFVYNAPALWEALLLHPYTANDRWANGDALEYVLTNPEKLALPAWLGMLSDTKAQVSLFAGLTTAALLAGSSAAMTALAASETAMYALTGSETMWAAVVASEAAMAAVAGSETAMRIVCGDAVAMQAVVESETAMAVLSETDAPLAKMCAALAGSNAYEGISSCANLIASTAVFGKVVQKQASIQLLSKSSVAMEALAASKAALLLIMNSAAAMEAIETSETAAAALAESPLKVSTSYSCENTWKDRNTNKLYLIGIRQNTLNSASYSITTATPARGSNLTVSTQLCYNTQYACNRFMKNLENYTNYTSSFTVGYTYIPLS